MKVAARIHSGLPVGSLRDRVSLLLLLLLSPKKCRRSDRFGKTQSGICQLRGISRLGSLDRRRAFSNSAAGNRFETVLGLLARASTYRSRLEPGARFKLIPSFVSRNFRLALSTATPSRFRSSKSRRAWQSLKCQCQNEHISILSLYLPPGRRKRDGGLYCTHDTATRRKFSAVLAAKVPPRCSIARREGGSFCADVERWTQPPHLITRLHFLPYPSPDETRDLPRWRRRKWKIRTGRKPVFSNEYGQRIIR